MHDVRRLYLQKAVRILKRAAGRDLCRPKRGTMNREYRIEDLTEEETAYIGRKINEIVPHEVDADEEEFILKVENENGEIVGGCIAEAYEYRWSRRFLDTFWVDERYSNSTPLLSTLITE